MVPTNLFMRLNGPPLFADHCLASSPKAMLALSLLFSVSAIIYLSITKRKRSRQKRRCSANLFKPSTKLPPCEVPAHPIFGHMPHVFSPPDSKKFSSVFLDHANSAGLSTFWFINVPSVSVLKAEHAKIVFRNSIERSGSKIITRHFKRCLGQGKIDDISCVMWTQLFNGHMA